MGWREEHSMASITRDSLLTLEAYAQYRKEHKL